jgi:hypothetical protein
MGYLVITFDFVVTKLPMGFGHGFFIRRRSQKLSTPTQSFLLLQK